MVTNRIRIAQSLDTGAIAVNTEVSLYQGRGHKKLRFNLLISNTSQANTVTPRIVVDDVTILSNSNLASNIMTNTQSYNGSAGPYIYSWLTSNASMYNIVFEIEYNNSLDIYIKTNQNSTNSVILSAIEWTY